MRRRPYVGFAVALAALVASVGIRWLLDPVLRDALPLVTLFGATAVAVWASGWRSAVVVAVIGFLACDWLFIPPRGALGAYDAPAMVGAIAYLSTSVIIIAIGELLHAARAREAEQSDLLRVTLASIGDAVLTTDVRGNITYLNPTAEKVTGWKSYEAAGKPIDEVFHIINERTRAKADNPANRALREGLVVGLANHTVLITRDGTERPIDDSAAPIRDAGGAVSGCVLIFRDITARRKLERDAAVRLADAQFLASIVDNSGDAIVSKSLDGVIQSWNASAERLFGYTADEAIGKHISLVIPPDRLAEEDDIVRRIRAGDRVDHFETVRARKDGRPIYVSLTISPIRDEQGRVIGASKIVRDIGDKKEAEERVYRLLVELRESDRRKDEFLAMLAHELRGPLAPIRNMLEVVKRVDDDKEKVQVARDVMTRQLNQLVRLVDDLIDTSRISRGRIELRPERLDLGMVLRQALDTSRSICENAGLDLKVTLPEGTVTVQGDPVRLNQVFSNLLHNACKYTPHGGSVCLDAHVEDETAVVSVSDNGLGIPPDKLGEIFELFTQVDTTRQHSQGGLGIGLSLAKRLIEMHGGSITAESEGPGKGSRFTVRLPTLEASGRAQPFAAPTAAPRGRRVLVVDDNPDAATSLATLLELGGNQTRVAHNGPDAIRLAEAFKPDVLLLDLGLPKMSGYEVCKHIREKPWGRNILIMALTGWGQPEDRRKTREAGFDGHLVKPVDYEKLLQALATGSVPTPL